MRTRDELVHESDYSRVIFVHSSLLQWCCECTSVVDYMQRIKYRFMHVVGGVVFILGSILVSEVNILQYVMYLYVFHEMSL